MKVELKQNGYLHVIPENETEALALEYWDELSTKDGRPRIVILLPFKGVAHTCTTSAVSG